MADTLPLPTKELIEALQAVLSQVAQPIQVLRTILEQAVAHTGAERGLFVEVEAGELEDRGLHGVQPGQLQGDAGRYSRPLFARGLETGEDVLLESVADDPALAPVESVRELRIASVLCMPIRAGRRIPALVYLEHRQEG